MIVLAERVKDSYATHATAILDALLPHLNKPPAIAHVRHTTSAFTAMSVLAEVFQWYKNHPMPSPAAYTTSMRLHESLNDFVYWCKRLLDGCRAKPDQVATLNGYDTIGRFLYTLFLTPTTILDDLSKNATILTVALELSICLYDGSPIIHPRGRPSDPSFDQPDASSAIIFMLARENAKAVADLINGGTICSPETFVERTVQRMRCFNSLPSIKRLSDLPEGTSERLNVHYIVALTYQLTDFDAKLRDLFMQARAPEIYFSALANQLRLVLQYPGLDERAEFLMDLAIMPIRWWGTIKCEGVLARVEAMVKEGGLFDLIGCLLPFSRVRHGRLLTNNMETDRRQMMVGHALAGILPYTLYPRVLAGSVAAMEKFVLPQINILPRDSPYREILPSLFLYLRNCGRLLPRDQQEPLCDNLNVSV